MVIISLKYPLLYKRLESLKGRDCFRPFDFWESVILSCKINFGSLLCILHFALNTVILHLAFKRTSSVLIMLVCSSFGHPAPPNVNWNLSEYRAREVTSLFELQTPDWVRRHHLRPFSLSLLLLRLSWCDGLFTALIAAPHSAFCKRGIGFVLTQFLLNRRTKPRCTHRWDRIMSVWDGK